ncbi:predicted protein [Streptomyces viridosporus ATCC 14672]|uniref:Predicted protein n=1 Tax=Streptomyces viridosporus (strain ATCC 14672 / DSM 40746 / JCM 4963 / KCTC 9882 / NRRL B-12104 / FH 1290) TaxID=566461 RepID=D6A3B4_STRV1|nr:predicted protein [Streptomyces viridosporus ATCC 14672]
MKKAFAKGAHAYIAMWSGSGVVERLLVLPWEHGWRGLDVPRG